MNREDKNMIDDLQVNPIQMPSDSYFEDLKKNLLEKVGNDSLQKSKMPRIIPMYKRWYVWGSAAAILAICFLFPWNQSNSPEKSGTSINLSSVSNEEIYHYLNENIEDLDAETIAGQLSRDAMINTDPYETGDVASSKENEAAFTSKSPLLEHVKDEEILDYLNDESGELDEYLLIES